MDALRELASLDNIVIQKADKGTVVVLIEKETYVNQMNVILGDNTKFSKLSVSEIELLGKLLEIEKEIIDVLEPLKNKGAISEKTYNNIKPVGSQPGKMYGLCKVHKGTDNGIPPFRPILSAISTPTYNLAKFLISILEPLTKNEFVIKDSFSFSEDIRKQNTKSYMTTFDVESLFTNIPLNETIEICVNKLYPRKNMKVNGLRKNEFRNLLELATKKSLFVFNGQYFSQTDGVAMGSPLGPTLANIFMCHHEEIWLDNCPRQFKPLYFRRYVDDIFVLFSKEDHVNKFDKYLNSRHDRIKFKKEMEKDSCISFLDVLITREDSFLTSLYRKPTFSGIYLNFFSYAPLVYKKGLISCLLFRIFNISSTWSLIHDEISKLKHILIKNRYPINLIDFCITKYREKLICKRRLVTTVSQKEIRVVLPFMGKYTNLVKNKLTKLVSITFPCCKLKCVFQSGRKIGSFFCYKDRIPFNVRSLVVYKFTCGDCNVTYIGKTKRHMKVRMNEHLGISLRTGKQLKFNSSNATAIRSHCETCHHSASYKDFSIIDTARNDFELLIKESIVIGKESPLLNKQVKSFQLALF